MHSIRPEKGFDLNRDAGPNHTWLSRRLDIQLTIDYCRWRLGTVFVLWGEKTAARATPGGEQFQNER